jgi:metallo-beta-lactamase family protein
MKITFFGAARNVTGSKHLIQTQGSNLLLDCGMYQGRRGPSNQSNKNLPFPAKEINAVILSHGHVDHSGLLPVLVKDGFLGRIYCTGPTAEITKYLLRDSASIQEKDCDYFNSHLGEGEAPISPIYTTSDAERTFAYFEPVSYFNRSSEWTELNKNIRFKFYDAGHILGSAITLLEIKEGGVVKTLAFTGDLGREDLPILRSPETIEEKVQTMIMECTYGGRIHRPIAEVADDLKEIICAAVRKKSKIIVPAFALGRAQELIYIIHKLIDEKYIPELPIYFDSPLSQNLTAIFARSAKYFDEEFWEDFGNRRESPFSFENLHYVSSLEESKSINKKQGPLMIIAASGMAEGGRILHHLKNNIGDPNNVILITGFQAENTLGRKILEGVSPVRIFGWNYDVRARVSILNELSAHADQKDLLSRVEGTKGLERLFLVHTEISQAQVFKDIAGKSFPSLPIEIPVLGQTFEI